MAEIFDTLHKMYQMANGICCLWSCQGLYVLTRVIGAPGQDDGAPGAPLTWRVQFNSTPLQASVALIYILNAVNSVWSRAQRPINARIRSQAQDYREQRDHLKWVSLSTEWNKGSWSRLLFRVPEDQTYWRITWRSPLQPSHRTFRSFAFSNRHDDR